MFTLLGWHLSKCLCYITRVAYNRSEVSLSCTLPSVKHLHTSFLSHSCNLRIHISERNMTECSLNYAVFSKTKLCCNVSFFKLM
ncbi:hypothetical protein NP493_376g01027 [Ridgeia piscesae]|uniref:Uncharacterized protein n=1 Tax=Ridgeia piscesae TaxID=27915 RepID=A0AAD9L356_RIDPI|nr:hypothetical protein NP493_376g01027 [Ridgeia piscesae]